MNNVFVFPNHYEILPAVLMILGGLFAMFRASSKESSFSVKLYINVFFLLAIFWQGLLLFNTKESQLIFSGFFNNSALVFFAQLFLIITAYLAALIYSDHKYQLKPGLGEKIAIIFFSTSGGYFLLSTENLISWYLCLEIVAISSYALVGSNLRSKLSTEAAIKYLLQGALGSCFILFSFSVLFGVTSEVTFQEIRTQLAGADLSVALLSLGFFLIGFFLKLGLIPFHYWVADVYQASETAIANYLAAIVKFTIAVSGFFFICGIYPDLISYFNKFIWVVIALSIFVGNLLALTQKDVKRMLAYSAIAHTAYFSIVFLDPSNQLFKEAFFAYLVFYSIVSLIIFSILETFEKSENLDSCLHLESLRGLIYRAPFLGVILIVALLSLAGLPPIFFALLAKVFVLKALLGAGYLGLSLIIILGTVLGCCYYFKLISLIISSESNELQLELSVSKTKMLILSFLTVTLIYYTIYPVRIFDYLQALILN